MKKILIIEDDQVIKATTTDLLEAEGFEVFKAENGAVGVKLATKHRPDLIICDIMMPEMSGYEVLEALQRDAFMGTTPFIFLSAMAENGAVRRGMNLGADDYLTKPYNSGDLVKAIRTRLAKKEIMEGRTAVGVAPKEEDPNHLIHFNSATALSNQTLFNELFDRDLLDQVDKGFYLPVLALSLDRFDMINQSLDNSWVNMLIKGVIGRLKSSLDDKAILTQWQRNQFVIIPGILKTHNEVIEVIEKLQKALAEPFNLGCNEFSVSASIGISLYPDHDTTIENLVKKASAIIYQLRKVGGNDYEFYNSEKHSGAFEQLALETALRQGLGRNEFEVYYQPQVDLVSNHITGVEALVRWRHPQKGLISPAQFIPLAEETGLIIPLGEWVLRTACSQIKAWQLAGLPDLRVAVNISACQFSQPDLVDHIIQILKETDFDPNFLELELTESTLIKNFQRTTINLSQLKSLGIKTALDDFGTGYSSLNYLSKFPFDVLKIDRCFVQNINNVPANRTISAATIQMAHNLNLQVVAEGVETFEELEVLVDQGCDIGQGYLFSKPVPALELERFLRALPPIEVNS